MAAPSFGRKLTLRIGGTLLQEERGLGNGWHSYSGDVALGIGSALVQEKSNLMVWAFLPNNGAVSSKSVYVQGGRVAVNIYTCHLLIILHSHNGTSPQAETWNM